MTASITGLVLAGGAGRRVGGRDKGTLPWHGRPLAQYVCDTLRPQVDELWISCNRSADFYQPLAERLITDIETGYRGPLAGIAAAARQLASPVMVVAPCDMPQLPGDLSARLCAALRDPALDVALAWDGERQQYLTAAIRAPALAGLEDFLASGGTAVRDWYATLSTTNVDFSDARGAFHNVNTLAERAT